LGRTRPLKMPRFDFTQFEYDRLIAHYDGLFGAENVFIFAYEEFAADPARFIPEFCRRLGLEEPDGLDEMKDNGAFRPAILPLARALNLFTRRAVANKTVILHIPFWYAVRAKLLELFDRMALFGQRPSPERLLGRRTFAWIEQRFWENNRALAERM